MVNEMPDADADDAILALVDLCGLDDFFLQGRREPPIDHGARPWLVVGSHNEASIMWSQAGCKHARAPWPPCGHQFGGAASFAVHDLHVIASMKGLLLTWVGNLRDWWQDPLGWRSNASIVAIADGKDGA